MLYDGAGSVETFRKDLPLLWVRAGLDSAQTNAEIARLASLALTQNAPITLINHPTGHHGFESRDADAATRLIIDQTLDFVIHATAPDVQRAIRR